MNLMLYIYYCCTSFKSHFLMTILKSSITLIWMFCQTSYRWRSFLHSFWCWIIVLFFFSFFNHFCHVCISFLLCIYFFILFFTFSKQDNNATKTKGATGNEREWKDLRRNWQADHKEGITDKPILLFKRIERSMSHLIHKPIHSHWEKKNN